MTNRITTDDLSRLSRRYQSADSPEVERSVLREFFDLSESLTHSIIQRLVSSSSLELDESLRNILMFSGLQGVKKGLAKTNPDKVTSVNYIFLWFESYVRREILRQEAPAGIPPSRYEKYKKIAAVRTRIATETGSIPSNLDVYNYFQSGKADFRGMRGRKSLKGKPVAANRAITLKLIAEQEEFEKSLIEVSDIEIEDSFVFSEEMTTPFEHTLFGRFLSKYPFTSKAKAVLSSELQVNPDEFREKFNFEYSNIGQKEYAKIARLWQDYLKDINGLFYVFLKEELADGAHDEGFDIRETIRLIEAEGFTREKKTYKLLIF